MEVRPAHRLSLDLSATLSPSPSASILKCLPVAGSHDFRYQLHRRLLIWAWRRVRSEPNLQRWYVRERESNMTRPSKRCVHEATSGFGLLIDYHRIVYPGNVRSAISSTIGLRAWMEQWWTHALMLVAAEAKRMSHPLSCISSFLFYNNWLYN